jgi:hypothetical protein
MGKTMRSIAEVDSQVTDCLTQTFSRYPGCCRRLVKQFAYNNRLTPAVLRRMKQHVRKGQMDEMTATAIIYHIHRQSRLGG